MARFGFVRSELEIKTLILHVLEYAKIPVSFDNIMSMSFVDDAIDYFEFTSHLAGMVETGHVDVCSDTGIDRYTITAKGVRDLTSCRSSVPRAVLRKAEKAADKVVDEVKRKNLVDVKVSERDGKFFANCSLKDDSGEVFSFSMSAMSRESAKKLTSNFYKNAERIYNQFLTAMLDESEK